MHVVIGAGGLAKQALPHYNKNPRVIFFDNTENPPKWLHFHQVVNDIEWVKEQCKKGPSQFSICIGNPKWREHFFNLLISFGATPKNVISEKSSIAQMGEIGLGNMILDYCLIETDVKIGIGNLLNCYSGLFHDVQVGDFNEIMPGAKLLGGSKIGNRCRIGSNSTILPNVEICSDVVIGAGAVVTKNITEPGTYIGIPAKKMIKKEDKKSKSRTI